MTALESGDGKMVRREQVKWAIAASTILIVDDDELTLKHVNRLLSEQFSVLQAASGEEMFAVLERERVDLILLDIHMPGMDGIEALRRLSGMERFRDIPVIFLSADEDAQTETLGFREGAMDFIKKPMRQDIAVQRIRRILELVYLQKLLQDEVAVQRMRADEEATDKLTGLPARSAGEKLIASQMEKVPGCLIFFDVDNLKKINDTIGHKSGDKVLAFVGEILCHQQKNLFACRLGGDEFLAFAAGTDEKEAVFLVESMLAMFEQRRKEDAVIRQSSLSAGLCMCTPDDAYSEIYSNADKALYHVKQNGKAGLFVYDRMKDIEEQSKVVDLGRVIKTLRKSGRYTGAMDVEYREFAKLYEYVKNLKRRYHYAVHLLTVTLIPDGDDELEVEELEDAMARMEQVICRAVRNVDICTRYTNVQFLVILIDANEENIPDVVKRIFKDFHTYYSESEYHTAYEVTQLQEE